MRLLAAPLAALLELAAPERCARCGAAPNERPWCARGATVPGLRPWDAPHLCRPCLADLDQGTAVRPAAAGCPAVWAARATGADLVGAVGTWKYYGVRGLAWPLASLLAAAARDLAGGLGAAPVLVPVPLHRRRRRQRGFNQAELLARLAAGELGWAWASPLRRVRATAQQARIAADGGRRRNLAGSCRTEPGTALPEGPLVLVDDIVTSGATLAEAARALAAAGRPPAAALALGLRVGSG